MFSSATDGTELWDVTPSCFVDLFLQNNFTQQPEAHGYFQVLRLTFKTLRLAVLAWIVCVWNFRDSWPTVERSASAPFPRLNHATVDCCGTPGISTWPAGWACILYKQRFGCHRAVKASTVIAAVSSNLVTKASQSLTQVLVFCLVNVWQWRKMVG